MSRDSSHLWIGQERSIRPTPRLRYPTGVALHTLVSGASVPWGRAILTFVDITSRVRAEHALTAATERFKLLSHLSREQINRSVNAIIRAVDAADGHLSPDETQSLVESVRADAWDVARQLSLAESYDRLGVSPPAWIGVQEILEAVRISSADEPVSIRYWTERLEIYADSLLREALSFIVEDSFYTGGTVRNIVAAYHETAEGLELIIENDGTGYPTDEKLRIFEYNACGHGGIGFFICRQILAVTGITITEIGTQGEGACFLLRVPRDGYRIEGANEDAMAFPRSDTRKPGSHGVRYRSGAIVHELTTAEFQIAEALWVDYHETTGDPKTDRIFVAFSDGEAVSAGRCRQHFDGFEVDGVFTPADQRGRGYARDTVAALVEACGQDPLFMYSVRELARFYGSFGFFPIGESELPPTIRERYAWAGGQLEAAEVVPMGRNPAPCSGRTVPCSIGNAPRQVHSSLGP